MINTEVDAVRNIKPDWKGGAHWVSFWQAEAKIKTNFFITLARLLAAFSSYVKTYDESIKLNPYIG
jgi:hypothetical protein